MLPTRRGSSPTTSVSSPRPAAIVSGFSGRAVRGSSVTTKFRTRWWTGPMNSSRVADRLASERTLRFQTTAGTRNIRCLRLISSVSPTKIPESRPSITLPDATLARSVVPGLSGGGCGCLVEVLQQVLGVLDRDRGHAPGTASHCSSGFVVIADRVVTRGRGAPPPSPPSPHQRCACCRH